MKITKVNIPTVSPEYGIQDDGLAPIVMDKLGDIILLAGKNGAGKSRILTKITTTIKQKPRKEEIKSFDPQIKKLNQDIILYNTTIANHKSSLTSSTNEAEKLQLEQSIKQYQKIIEQFKNDVLHLDRRTKWGFIETDELYDSYQVVHFVPKKLDLTDCNELTPERLKQYANNVNALGVNELADCSLAKIKKVVDRKFNATHPDSHIATEEKQNAINEYQYLDDLIHIFLDTRLDRNLDGDATLFGFPIGSAHLSDGQKILLQLCVAIHAQGASLDNMVLFLDEPENHMHPSVTIEFLDVLIKKVPHGQIWIATHSIPLISHFGTENIWYVDNGKVSYAGKEQEKVLESLLGNESEVGRLSDFMNLPAASAINNFAYECLSPPATVMTTPEDPQSAQIGFILMDELKKGKVKLLDYGAGKGRFISNLFDRQDTEEEKELIRSNLEYVAFDKYTQDEVDCRKNIERVYGSSGQKYYNNLRGLLSDHDNGTFDVVVLCNVLHEIDPKDWLNLFNTDISPLLKADSGFLLHIEDMLLPVGEKAYRNGFVVLDTPHVKELFQLSSSDFRYFTSENEKYKDRLKAHLIPQDKLSRITGDTRIKALAAIQGTAADEIRGIREMPPSYKNGRKYAFWIQQFANSCLALDELLTKHL